MSRYLFINQYYWPDEAATAQLLADLTEYLAAAGHEVTVVCGRGRYSAAGPLPAGESWHAGVRIVRVNGTDGGRFSWGGRLSDGITFLAAAWWRMRFLPRHDVVVAMTSPPWVGRLGVEYHRHHGTPLVSWVQDIYPEIAVKLGVIRNPWVIRLLERQSALIGRESARLVAPAEDMRDVLMAHLGERVCVAAIPNWARTDLIQPGPVRENSFRREKGWLGDRVLMYSGNAGRGHDFDAMLRLTARLHEEMKNLRFVLVGDTPRHARVAAQARRMGVTRFTCLPTQSRSRLGEVLGAADAHLVTQRTETNGLMMPSKFYGIVAAGRPVIYIGPPCSEIGRLVSGNRLGVAVAPEAAGEKQDVARVVNMAQDEPGVVEDLRGWAMRNASHEVRLPQFAALLKEVEKC
ncbi:MAG: glycosyltransferase family 4 protein [Verrucomicrobiae bacterium]|nr:glycosyltransferase family 4 protein [Verrucomicrobiae bacterium]